MSQSLHTVVTFAVCMSIFPIAACTLDGESTNKAQDSIGSNLNITISAVDNRSEVRQFNDNIAIQSQQHQLAGVSAMVYTAIENGEIIANPFDDSGKNPYVFASIETQDAFYQLLDEAGLTVTVSFPTVNELEPMAVSTTTVAQTEFQTDSYCGPGHECSSVSFCDGGIVDCSYGYCNTSGAYGAYTNVDDFIPGSMTPFSAEVSLPYYASALGDYNFNYNAPHGLYIDTISSSSSADRSKHRCCYWFWGYPSWTIQCSPYFYNEL